MQNDAAAMAATRARQPPTGLRLSLSQKLGLLIAIVLCVGVGGTVFVQLKVRQQTAIDEFRNSNLQVAQLVAQQISGRGLRC